MTVLLWKDTSHSHTEAIQKSTNVFFQKDPFVIKFVEGYDLFSITYLVGWLFLWLNLVLLLFFFFFGLRSYSCLFIIHLLLIATAYCYKFTRGLRPLHMLRTEWCLGFLRFEVLEQTSMQNEGGPHARKINRD